MKKQLYAAVCFLFFYLSQSLQAGVFHDSRLNWKSIESEHFYIHFHDGGEEVAQRFVALADGIHNQVTAFLDWVPRGKTHVVLSDEYDLSNGFATFFPNNFTTVFLSAPEDISALEDHNGWLEYVFRHEYLHIVHLDKVKSGPAKLQNVVGRHPLLFPNALQQTWFVEGLATYIETDKNAGLGRGQSSFFDMLMRMEVQHGFKPLRQINQLIASWPAGHVPYLYGVNYMNFIEEKYGEPKIQKLVENYSGNFLPFRVYSNPRTVFNKNLDVIWNEFAEYTINKHQQRIAQISAAGLRQGRPLEDGGYNASSLRQANGKLYYYDFNGETHARIMVYQPGQKPRELRDVNLFSRFDVHPDKGLIIAQPELCRNTSVYYDLYSARIDGSGLTRLTHCARYRRAVWSPAGDRILAVQNKYGTNELHLLNPKGELQEVLWRGTTHEQIGHMDWSPLADEVAISIWRKNLGWNIEVFNLNDRSWRVITRNSSIQQHPAYTKDGSAILFTSDEDSVYNLYRYDVAQQRHTRLTRLISGAFYPAMVGDKLYYIGYQHDGFDLHVLDNPLDEVAQSPLVTDSQVSEPSATAQEKAAALPVKEYSALPSLRPRWWMPTLLVDDQRSEIGAATSGSDVLNRHIYSVNAAYDFDNEYLVGGLNYFYDGLYPLLQVGYNSETDLFEDGNDDPVRIRREDLLIAQAIIPFFKFDRTLSLHTAIFSEREKDIWTRQGFSPLRKTRNDYLGLAAIYDSTQNYPLSVSRSEGREIRFIFEDSDVVGNSDSKGQIYVLDWREFFHLGSEHVIGLRLVEGRGDGNPTRFSLGGIQGNTNVLGTVLGNAGGNALFNRREYTLRGYDEGLAQLRGKNLRLLSLEYRFPLARIERGGMGAGYVIPPLGINQLHATLFYDIGGVWNDDRSSPADHFAGTGVEINTDVDLFYNLRLNLAFGFATGLDNTLGEDKFYVRIGSQF